MKTIHKVAAEIAVREIGWRQIGSWWVNTEMPRPRFLDLSEVLLHEWKETAARAGRGDHRRQQLQNVITCCLFVITGLAAVALFFVSKYLNLI